MWARRGHERVARCQALWAGAAERPARTTKRLRDTRHRAQGPRASPRRAFRSRRESGFALAVLRRGREQMRGKKKQTGRRKQNRATRNTKPHGQSLTELERGHQRRADRRRVPGNFAPKKAPENSEALRSEAGRIAQGGTIYKNADSTISFVTDR